jgi:hypothetical protein
MRTSSLLQLHIILLSLTATLGLLVLFHVIGAYGALIASLVMTIRQFVSILTNATVFGSMAQIPLYGWAGIGFIVAGVWIKMGKRQDKNASREERLAGKGTSASEREEASRGMGGWLWQYGVPLVVCPLVFVVFVEAVQLVRELPFGQMITVPGTSSAEAC